MSGGRSKVSNLLSQVGPSRFVWNYFQGLKQKLNDKAEVNKIISAYTPQTCTDCGDIDQEKRKMQAVFQCEAFDHTEIVDLNVVRNLLACVIRATVRRGILAFVNPLNSEKNYGVS